MSGDLPKTIEDREYNRFVCNDSGEVAVRTVTEGQLTGEIRPSGLNNGGRVTVVTLNSATWTALPATPLTDRNALGIQNESAQNIKVNYENPTLPAGFEGMTVGPGSERTYDVTDNIIIYAKCQTGTVDINVEEIS